MINKTTEQINQETFELEAELKQFDSLRFCMIEQQQIDASVALNALSIVVAESKQFLIAYAELLNKSDEIILLNDDSEIMTKIERWKDLMYIAERSDDSMLKLESVCFILMLNYLTYDEMQMIRAKQTVVTLASTIITALNEASKYLYRFEIFDYDYSELIAENKKYRAIAKGEKYE